jgi:hypothetical protein
MDDYSGSYGNEQVSGKISSQFSDFLGDNADTVVQGLRSGEPFTLSSSSATTGDTSIDTGSTTTDNGTSTADTGSTISGADTTTDTGITTADTGTTTDTGNTSTEITIDPPTGKMGHGNVFMSLALAEEQLSQYGITQPTATELEAAFLGGMIDTPDGSVQLQGVLQMRADGMGWGQIAQEYGVKLGHVVSSIKSANNKIATTAGPDETASGDADTSGGSVTETSTVKAGSHAGKTTGKADTARIPKQKYVYSSMSGKGGHVYGRGITSGNGHTSGQLTSADVKAGKTNSGHGKNIISGKSNHVTSAGGAGNGHVSSAGGKGYGHSSYVSHGSAGVVTASGAVVSGSVSSAGGNGKAYGKGGKNK